MGEQARPPNKSLLGSIGKICTRAKPVLFQLAQPTPRHAKVTAELATKAAMGMVRT